MMTHISDQILNSIPALNHARLSHLSFRYALKILAAKISTLVSASENNIKLIDSLDTNN